MNYSLFIIIILWVFSIRVKHLVLQMCTFENIHLSDYQDAFLFIILLNCCILKMIWPKELICMLQYCSIIKKKTCQKCEICFTKLKCSKGQIKTVFFSSSSRTLPTSWPHSQRVMWQWDGGVGLASGWRGDGLHGDCHRWPGICCVFPNQWDDDRGWSALWTAVYLHCESSRRPMQQRCQSAWRIQNRCAMHLSLLL